MNMIDLIHPPSLELSTPAWCLPAGATDCHAHVFETRFALQSKRSYTPAEASIASYTKMLKTLGFERAVLVQPSVYGTDNTSILTCMNETESGITLRHKAATA